MEPTVSILVPSFNHEAYIRRCLESVLAQTYPRWELIVLDDGSTDQSLEMVRSVQDSRIHLYQNDINLGTYGTLQRALEFASGSLVAVLNSDDEWDPSKLARQVHAMQEAPSAQFCYTLGTLIREAGCNGIDVHGSWPIEPHQDLLPYLLAENRVLACSVMFRRSGLSFESSCRYSGDWVALLRASRLGDGLCIPERLSRWRLHGHNTHLASFPQKLEEIRVRRAIQRRENEWLRSPSNSDLVRRSLSDNRINLAALYLFLHQRGLAVRALGGALRLRPTASSIKRLLAVLLPQSYVHRRLFPGQASPTSPEVTAAAAAIAQMPDIDLSPFPRPVES